MTLYILAANVAEATAVAAEMGTPLRSMARNAVWINTADALSGRRFLPGDVLVETEDWRQRLSPIETALIESSINLSALIGVQPERVLLDRRLQKREPMPNLRDRQALEAWLDS